MQPDTFLTVDTFGKINGNPCYKTHNIEVLPASKKQEEAQITFKFPDGTRWEGNIEALQEILSKQATPSIYQHPEFETDLSMCKFNEDEYEYDVDENLQLTIYLDAPAGDIETQYHYEDRKQIDHDLKLATEQYGITFKQYGGDIAE